MKFKIKQQCFFYCCMVFLTACLMLTYKFYFNAHFPSHNFLGKERHLFNDSFETALLELNATLFDLRSQIESALDRPSSTVSMNIKNSTGREPKASELNLQALNMQKDVSQVSMNSLAGKRAIIFTMDSIASYEENSLVGGAAGELTVRRSLQQAFTHLSISFRVAKSDEEFNGSNLDEYDFVVLDPWTWAQKGVEPKRFLTAYGSPWNTFLGYFIAPSEFNSPNENGLPVKKQQGVIWGKDSKHFAGREWQVQTVADKVPVVSTASSPALAHKNIKWLGHQSSDQWMKLLAESKFLMGLGNPLLGPSAIDAISVGCVFLNPIYATPMRSQAWFGNQHPYAQATIGEPYVCSFRQDNERDLLTCVDKALKSDLPPFIPSDFTFDEYIKRVRRIFTEL